MNAVPYPVQQVIERLYCEFSKYPLDRNMPGDPAFPGLTDNSLITAKPLRQLTSNDLSMYLRKAITTWGTINDFKHFLPRIFELLAQSFFCGIDLDRFLVFQRLAYAQLLKWPSSERPAVEMALKTLLIELLKDADSLHSDLRAFELLVGIAGILDDVSPYLTCFDEDEAVNSNLQLAYFILQQKDHLLEFNSLGIYDSSHHYERSKQGDQIAHWLRRKSIKERLEAAFFKCQNSNLEKIYSEAIFWHDQWAGIKTN